MSGRDDEPDEHADQAADQRQRQRLDEELAEDVPAPGAEGLADADLAGPLADRDQHDVHDPDPADDERDRGDPAEQQGQRAADRRGGLEQLGLVEDRGSRPCRWRRARGGPGAAPRSRRAPLHVAPSATLTPIERTPVPPTKYFARRRSGTRTWSSGSLKPAPPFGWRMPTTSNGMPPTRISVPDGVGAEAEVARDRRPEDDGAKVRVDGGSVRNVPCQTS